MIKVKDLKKAIKNMIEKEDDLNVSEEAIDFILLGLE